MITSAEKRDCFGGKKRAVVCTPPAEGGGLDCREDNECAAELPGRRGVGGGVR